jgi:hypothetical protein
MEYPYTQAPARYAFEMRKPRTRRGLAAKKLHRTLIGGQPVLKFQKSSSQFLPSSIEIGAGGDGSATEPVTTGSSSTG